MTYIRLDDNITRHPKIVGLTDPAFRLYIAGLCYSSQLLTDGILPGPVIPQLTPTYRPRHLTELTDRILWTDLNHGSYYEIHDYLNWNKSRSEVETYREQQRQRAKKRWGT